MSEPPISTKGNLKAPAKGTEKSLRALKPNKKAPLEAANQVRNVVKMKYSDYDKVAVALAPLFGLGSDLIASQRAQGLFKHRPFLETFSEFADSRLEGRWDVPVADWVEVIEGLRALHDDSGSSDSPDPKERHCDVNDYYVRFLSRAMHDIQHPTKSTKLVYWIKDADVEDGYWMLFHAFMYLQLESMREYRHRAPIRDRISHMLGR